MTRNMIFGGLIGGALVLIAINSLFSSDDRSDNWDGWDEDRRVEVHLDSDSDVVVSGGISVESRGNKTIVRTSEGSFDCSKNGRVIIKREDGSTIEVICD